MEDISEIGQDLKQAISHRDRNLALSLFRSGLQQNEAKFVAKLQKIGVLRCSNYDFQSQILNSLLNETRKLNISQVSRVYFESVSSLLSISRDVQILFKALVKEVDALEIKSYLVAVDSLFWLLYDLQQDCSKERSISKEDLASAFSLYIYYSHDNKVIGKSQLNEVNEKRLNKKYYLTKLKDFNKILFFKECEIFVDRFGYTFTQNNTKLTLKAPSKEFEMSLSLGYIRYSVQYLATSLDSFSRFSANALSIHELSQKYYEEFEDSTFKIIDQPLKRVVMQLPNVQPLIKLLGNKNVFLEEAMLIKQIETDFFIDFEKIAKITVYKSLSLFDIIKTQRLFAFIFFLFKKYIESNNLFKSKLFWRSVLPVYQVSDFKELLSSFFGKQKATEVFDLLSWRLESEKIFDLQTYPFINIEDRVVLPLGILANSNLCRNVIQSTRFRFDSESSEDPIVLAMEKCLKPVSLIIETNLEYSFQGIEGDVDILAVVDNYLFIFECKNSLHPCNPFELRTTYDYIQKAATQLTRFRELWQKESFRTYLATKIKAQEPWPSQLCSCIVTGNRMFSGLREKGHSVRPIHELCNIIRTGEIFFNLYDSADIDAAKENIGIKLWKREKLNGEDLFDYIQKDSLHSYYFNSMTKVEKKIQLNKKFLVQESYHLSPESFLQQLVDNFRLVKPQ